MLDVEASELHRIERDLHDGAQQRLVMLTIDLGLASERIDSDPEAAKKLVLEGQDEARQALAELRDLVRGIAPAILLDRGLVAAIGSIASRGPIPTIVQSELPAGERLPIAVERAAYFVVAEALANVAKHSNAKRCEVRCRRELGNLVVEVWDDGIGGATMDAGGGLAGLAGRVGGVDGTFAVTSPPNGGTLVRATLPVAGWGAAQAPVSTGWTTSGESVPAGTGVIRGGRDRPAALRPEIGQDGEDAAVVVLRVGQVQLSEDVADVLLGGTFRDPEQGADPDVCPTLGHGREHFAFPRRERGERVIRPARHHQLRDDLRIERRATAGDASERVHELADVADAILEEVPDTTTAIGEEFRRVLPFDVLAQDEHRRPRHLAAGLDRGSEAFVTLRRRHPNVHDGHVRAVGDDRLDERRAVGDLGHDRAPGLLDQPRDALADERRVLGNDDAQGFGFHASMMHHARHAGERRT